MTMNIMSDSPLRQLRCVYLAPVGIYLASWLWLPAAWLWPVLLLFCLLCWKRAVSLRLKTAYRALMQAIGIHLGCQLLALGALMMAGKYNHGGLFSGAGAQNFGYLIGYLLLAAVLALAGTIWPAVRLVRSYRQLMTVQEAQP
ncbi:hypothetical protein [Ferrimonas sp. YFM]|uniref:hypothetical protein n=1 Tax=Ferrimonas sp. YFM TaxID=3028878 RepID=UPI002574710D|nr:hypothetical protein [Ferrimonas sp. YFM]BDY05198.1 hypothetical protein F0521_22390 [Ferrimonas sp. YFM]